MEVEAASGGQLVRAAVWQEAVAGVVEVEAPTEGVGIVGGKAMEVAAVGTGAGVKMVVAELREVCLQVGRCHHLRWRLSQS